MGNNRRPSSNYFSTPPAIVQSVPKPVGWKAPYLHLPLTKPELAFALGDTINGRYEVKNRFHGSMGVVFQCYDRTGQCDVAMKTLIDTRKDDRNRVYAFYEEVQKRIQLEPHCNVVKFKQIELIDGYPYIVSEWIEGHKQYGNSLESWMASYSFTLPDLVDFLQQTCAGLRHCHQQISTEEEPFVLGDLKPENILVTETKVFKLADFSTHSYTIDWESPEQRQKQRLDERSDIYTLGLIGAKLISTVAQPAPNDPLERRVKELLHTCLMEELSSRMLSWEALDSALTALCREFDLPQYVARVQHKSFLDSIYRLHSELNLGITPSLSSSLSEQSWGCSNGFFQGGVAEFAEYARIPDLDTYEAEAALRRGDPDRALKLLSRPYFPGEEKSSRYFYLLGLAHRFKNEPLQAICQFDAASSKELYLPALDAKADILLQNPALLQEQSYCDNVKDTLDRFFHVFYDRSNGYLSNQIYGKYLLILGENAFASRAFQESLFFPNAGEWNNLYYYGVCEYRQKNVYKALAVFSSVTQVICSDPHYMDDFKKALTLLFCWYTLAKEDETEQLVAAICSKYKLNFQHLLDSLRLDCGTFHNYWEKVQELEHQYSSNTDALREQLHALLDVLEREGTIESYFLMGDLFSAISTREIAILFQRQQYQEAIAACDRALAHDHCHPMLLKNKGACYLMEENYSLADACYRLSAFYELDPQRKQESQGLMDRIHKEHPGAFALNGNAVHSADTT